MLGSGEEAVARANSQLIAHLYFCQIPVVTFAANDATEHTKTTVGKSWGISQEMQYDHLASRDVVSRHGFWPLCFKHGVLSLRTLQP